MGHHHFRTFWNVHNFISQILKLNVVDIGIKQGGRIWWD